MIVLSSLFDEFCKHFNGRLTWKTRVTNKSEWTEEIWQFFSELNKKDSRSFKEEREHMLVDYLWRDLTEYYQKIVLAVEHENDFQLDDFLETEVQHLLDIKADNKVTITYPQLGDENRLLKDIGSRINQYATKINENWLLILGFPTRKNKKLAIRFVGYVLDQWGHVIQKKDKTIFQSS